MAYVGWAVSGLVAANAVLSWAGAAVAVRLERRESGAGMKVWKLLAGLLVGLTLAAAFVFHWPSVPHRLLAGPGWVLVDDLLLLAPVLAMILTQMACRYWFERKRRGTMSLGLGRYLLLRGRVEVAMVLVPWLGLMLLTDIARVLFDQPALEAPLTLGAVAVIVVLSPLIIRHVWNTSSLPPGPMRDRLEDFCRRTGFRCNDLLVWHTERHLANAGVVGPTPLVRYVLLSDVLLERFDPAEVEAIFAHEVGHVRCRHMLFYMVFALAFIVFYGNVMEAFEGLGLLGTAGGAWLGDIASQAVFMLVFAALYWGVGFGIISRRMEQQADLYALDNAADPMAFVAALEKLAVTDYVPRRSSFWRHFSIERRTDFLHEVLQDPSLGQAYERRVRRIKWGFCIAAAAALVNLLIIEPGFFTMI
jgi:Zn-dependent protease with chaperone function